METSTFLVLCFIAAIPLALGKECTGDECTAVGDCHGADKDTPRCADKLRERKLSVGGGVSIGAKKVSLKGKVDYVKTDKNTNGQTTLSSTIVTSLVSFLLVIYSL